MTAAPELEPDARVWHPLHGPGRVELIKRLRYRVTRGAAAWSNHGYGNRTASSHADRDGFCIVVVVGLVDLPLPTRGYCVAFTCR